MSNAIERDVYVLRNTLKNPISYVRGTDLLPIIFHFRDFTIPSGATATAFTAKPDGNAVYGSATISENDVTVDVQQQMFIVLGLSMLQVEIKSGEETLATFVQPVMVEPNLKAGDFPPSTTDINFLDKIIEQAQEAVDNANQAVEDANTAISGANTAASSANQAAQNANQAAEDLQDKVDAGDFTASVQVGTTTTLEPGQDATVSNGGTSKDAVLNFGIPKGDPGAAATIQVGTTQTVQPEENAEVTNTGTASAAVLDFKIPRGADGMTDLTAEYKDASEYTCEPTVNAPVVVKEVEGKTEQVETTGAQLFDVESYPFMDGKWVSYNIGDMSSDSLYKCTDFIPFSGYDRLTINLNHIPSGSNPGMAFYGSDAQESYISGGKGNAITVPEGTQYMRFTVDASVPDDDVMLNKGSTALPYEPYTGGSPSPSPDYPQVIKGVGGMGYFDGEWVQGNISSTGAIGTETTGITSANAIPCKQNDNIAVTYEDSIDVIAVTFYNASGAYISTSTSGNSVDTFTATAPANAASFKVNLRVVSGSTITPNGAKYCTVTINGEYQTEIKSRNINLWNGPEQYTGSVQMSSTFDWTGKDEIYIEFDALTDNTDGQVIVNLDYYNENGTKVGRNGAAKKVSTSFTHFSAQFDGRNSVNGGGKTDLTKIKRITAILNIYQNSASEFSVKNVMFSDEQLTDVTYVSHKEFTLTIPLTAPLYEGDKICYVKPGDKYVNADGETVTADRVLYGCYRENAIKKLTKDIVNSTSGGVVTTNDIIDGRYTAIQCNNYQNIINKALYNNSTLTVGKCNIAQPGKVNDWNINSGGDSNIYTINDAGAIYIATDISFLDGITTSSTKQEVNTAVKNFVENNDVWVTFKIAQPYFEPFADQSIFYDLRTDDTLSYVYSSDPIEPNVTVEVAKNETGGYLLESYAQAQKNAISEANSQSRISAIEQQLVNQATTPTE